VPVRARPVRRASRLLASPTKYVLIQGANILRITALYKPLKIFSAAAALFLLGGAVFGMRVLFAQPSGDIRSHALALSLAAMLDPRSDIARVRTMADVRSSSPSSGPGPT